MKTDLRRLSTVLLSVGVLVLVLGGAALAAEFQAGDAYRLPEDQIIDDDLYVSAGEVYIDGVIDGDLYASGGYVEVNGEVTGDVVAAGAGVVIRGSVGDDVRVAGASIDISGTVADDVFAAGGGTPPGGFGFSFPFRIGERTIQPGIRIASSTEIAGDAVIVGGSGQIDGAIGGDLFGGMGSMVLGAQVTGDARLEVEDLTIEDGSVVQGTLTYATPSRLAEADQLAPDVQFEQQTEEADSSNLVIRILGWLVRTILILLGFALLGWLVLRLAPDLLARSAAAINAAPVEVGLYGLVAVVLLIFIPLLSGLLVVLTMLFWGVFPAIVMFLFLFGGLGLFWFFSPLVTGFWLGGRILEQAGERAGLYSALLLGILVIVLLGRLPILGWLVYLVSLVIAMGGLIRARRSDQDPPTASEMAAAG